ncbi:MAG: hypothetical protein ABIH39_02340 [Candidatus Margulisiibacteriota bacterium]
MLSRKLNMVMSLFLFLVLIMLSGTIVGCSSISSIKEVGTKAISDLTKSTEEEGNPDWWKEQPDRQKEEEIINASISEITSAFSQKNVEQVLNHITPLERDKYRQLFLQSPDLMSEIAEDLNTATINYLSSAGPYGRFAEYKISVDGQSFSIVFVKVDDKWLIQTL